MNPFLKEFGATSNENLHLRIMQEPELKEAYQSYETSLNDYHDQITDMNELSNSAAMKNFIAEHNFHALKEPTLILFSSQYKLIGKIDLDVTNDKWISKDTASKVLGTPYVAVAALHLPYSKAEQQHIPLREIENDLSRLDISLIDTFVSTNKEVTSLTEIGMVRWNIDHLPSMSHDSNLQIHNFIQPEVFNKSSIYLTGYYEFKQYLAERKIHGLHINEDASKIKDILIDTYKTQPYETANLICFDKEGFVSGMERLSKGTTTRVTMYPAEVAKRAVEHEAHAFSLVHNHPSGVAEPSDADISVTKEMQKVADLVGRPIVDHYIVASNEICSFVELNLLQEYRGFEDPELER